MPTTKSLELIVTLVLFVSVGAASFFPRRALASRAWQLLRCLWPSWRFFDVPAALPLLRFRVAARHDAYGDFCNVLEPKARAASSLLLNADFNLVLAYASAVETLAAELTAQEPKLDPVSYEIVRRLVELRVNEFCERVERYQFALFDAGEDEPWFMSEPHTLASE